MMRLCTSFLPQGIINSFLLCIRSRFVRRMFIWLVWYGMADTLLSAAAATAAARAVRRTIKPLKRTQTLQQNEMKE